MLTYQLFERSCWVPNIFFQKVDKLTPSPFSLCLLWGGALKIADDHDAGVVDGLEGGGGDVVEHFVVIAAVLEPDVGEAELGHLLEHLAGDLRRSDEVDDVP